MKKLFSVLLLMFFFETTIYSQSIDPIIGQTNFESERHRSKFDALMVMLYAGASFPIKNFANEHYHGALTAFTAGLDGIGQTSLPKIKFNYTVNYTGHHFKITSNGLNNFERTGLYDIVNLVVGIRYQSGNSQTQFYISALAGVNYTFVDGFSDRAIQGFTFPALHPGFGIVANRLTIGAKYLIAKPKFKGPDPSQVSINSLQFVVGMRLY